MTASLWNLFEEVVAQRGAAPAILQGDRRVSFAELHRMAIARATAMIREGVKPGDRCLFWSANSPDLAATMLAAWRVASIVVLVNDEAPVGHLAHAASVTRPALAFVDAARADLAERSLAAPVRLIAPIQPESNPAPAVVASDRDPASIFFTSGSTGLPKGVTQTHASLVAGCRMVAAHLRLRSVDRILCPIPWAFDYGYGQFLSTVVLGITQVLPTARNPFALCEAIETHRPTVFASLPAIFALLLRGLSPLRETNLSSLRLVTNTGGLIAPSIFADVLQVFSHCEISLNYGLTETYRSAGLPMTLARERPESVGFAYPGVTLTVVREDGTEAEPDEVGEVVHRGTGTFLGYWEAPDATARVLRPDPSCPAGGTAVFTGDLGWKDRAGFLMVKGRRDRLIKSMGVRVSPDEVETLIRGTGLVRDVAVVGIPHDVIGEMVVAAVTIADNAPDPLLQLKALSRRAMSQHMQPRAYRILDAFPLTPNGKTDFSALRTLMSQPLP